MSNPLSNHTKPKINAIIKGQGQEVKTKVEEVKTLMKDIYEALIKFEILKPKIKEATKRKKYQDIFANIMPL